MLRETDSLESGIIQEVGTLEALKEQDVGIDYAGGYTGEHKEGTSVLSFQSKGVTTRTEGSTT